MYDYTLLLPTSKPRLGRFETSNGRLLKKKKLFYLKAITLKKCVVAVIVLCIVSIVFYSYYMHNNAPIYRWVAYRFFSDKSSLIVSVLVLFIEIQGRNRIYSVAWWTARVYRKTMTIRRKRVFEAIPKFWYLLKRCIRNWVRISRNFSSIRELSKCSRKICLVFGKFYVDWRYKIEVSGKSVPVLTNLDKGRYGAIVFENFNKYLLMDKWNRELLDKYCREYFVGIIGFINPSEETLVGAQLKGFPLFIHTNLRLQVCLEFYLVGNEFIIDSLSRMQL